LPFRSKKAAAFRKISFSCSSRFTRRRSSASAGRSAFESPTRASLDLVDTFE
jgi:hypothetical protein